ncbi:PAS domain-containing sensor histidine kinase [Ekhidna sp.]
MKRITILFSAVMVFSLHYSVASKKIAKTPLEESVDPINLSGNVAVCSTTLDQVANPTFTSYFSGLLITENWPARWTCGNWSQTEGWLYISADISIFLAYLSIPIMLLWFIRKKQLGRTRWLIALFGAFILLCGFTHLIDVVLFWEPMYRLSGFSKLLTGLVSVTTATVLGFVIPKALEFKSPDVLQAEIDDRKNLQNQFELFVKYSPGAIAMLDKDMKYIMVNDGWYEDYGLVGRDIIGKSHYDIFPEIKEMPNWLDDHRKALSGETLKKDLDTFGNGDDVTYLSWQLRPWMKADGSVGGIMMFTEILTDEVIIKKRLKDSEARFENLFDKAMIGIALVGGDGKPFLVNDQLCTILGYSKEELAEMPFTEFTHPEDIEKDWGLYTKLLEKEIDSYTIEKRYFSKGGDTVFAKLNVTLVEPGTDNQYALAMVEDLTKTEEALQKGKVMEQKAQMFNNLFTEISSIAKIGTWEVDLNSGKCAWSYEVYEIHEEDPRKEIRVEEGINYYHPDDRDIIQEAINRSIAEEVSWDLELRIITTKGNERWVRALGRPIYEEDEIVKLQGLFQDIDIKKRYELEIIESRKNLENLVNQRTLDLKTANEELESFSYSVSHDLRAPLRAISGFSEALVEDYAETLPAEANQYLSRISANSNKMGELIDDLLEFSRMNRNEANFSEIDLNKLVEKLMNDLFLDSVDIVTVETLPQINGDREMLAQVFVNLLSNAIKYSSKEENPNIILSSIEEKLSYVISVKDNGVGFNMDYSDKLFQVFQRLHSETEFEGTGVGLSLCGKIMKAHHGEIWAEAEEGKGATFYLRFKKT